MQFLKTLLWVLIAVLVALFASRNWAPVTLNLWGDIQADIKIPVLLAALFLLGLLPTWIVMRAKLWTMQRRLEALERSNVAAPPMAEPATAPVPAAEKL
jgi:putative membrane protein